MKPLLTVVFAMIISATSFGQDILGAWQLEHTSEDGNSVTNTIIFAEGYFASTWYETGSGTFLRTNGGSWEMNDGKILAKLEFDSETPERVGTDFTIDISLDKDIITFIETKQQWKRLDNGTPGALQGAWLMSGRKRDGEIQTRDTSRSRKTMKILSGTSFQWIAYDTATKEFKGTGGGTYTTIDGKYTENIEFFSRDNTRVGSSLEFNYELIDGAWHHSGKSSKGKPLYEIWSTRQ